MVILSLRYEEIWKTFAHFKLIDRFICTTIRVSYLRIVISSSVKFKNVNDNVRLIVDKYSHRIGYRYRAGIVSSWSRYQVYSKLQKETIAHQIIEHKVKWYAIRTSGCYGSPSEIQKLISPSNTSCSLRDVTVNIITDHVCFLFMYLFEYERNGTEM